MKRSALASSAAVLFCFSFATPLLAAQPAPASTESQTSPSGNKTSAADPAAKCLSDLRAFDNQMDNEGYWLGGSGYGYGYPMAVSDSGPPAMAGRTEGTGMIYQNARPGYELRTLMAAADILARQGQQQPCEDVLGTTRDIYKVYISDMQSGKVPRSAVQNWRQQQLAAAQPVADTNTSLRTTELVGTEVRTPQNGTLGSVEDLVMNPQTSKVAYVVIARGGIFGLDEKYVPVPWDAFKIAPNANLLVLSIAKDALDTAPQVTKTQFTIPGNFDQLGQKVDTYWKTHLTDKAKD